MRCGTRGLGGRLLGSGCSLGRKVACCWLVAAAALHRGVYAAAVDGDLLEVVMKVAHALEPEGTAMEGLVALNSAASEGSMLKERAEAAILHIQSNPGQDIAGASCSDIVLREEKPLGVLFQEVREQLIVQEMDPGGLFAKSKQVKLGDTLIAVNLESVQGRGLQGAAELISETRGPKLFRFCSPSPAQLQRQKQEQQQHLNAQSARVAEKAEKAARKAQLERTFTAVVKGASTLGIRLLEDLVVQDVDPSGELAGKVEPGDMLKGINNKDISSLDLEDVVGVLRSAVPPLVLEFSTKRKASGDEASEDENFKIAAGGFHSNSETSSKGAAVQGAEAELILTFPPILAGSSYTLLMAQFSGTPSCNTQNLALLGGSNLEMACKATGQAQVPENTLVLVLRGECTFVTKARTIEALGGAGMLVVSRDFESTVAMPSGAGELASGPVQIPAAMLNWPSGSAVSALLQSGPLKGWIKTPNCGEQPADFEESASAAGAEAEIDYSSFENEAGRVYTRHQVKGAVETLVWSAALGETKSIYGIYADWGPKFEDLPSAEKAEPIMLKFAPEPYDACAPFGASAEQLHGAMVVVYRGSCTFGDKAMQIQNAGGRGMILINNEAAVSKLHALIAPPELMARISIPSVMINSTAGEELRQLLLPGSSENDGARDPLAASQPKVPLTITKIVRKNYYYCNRAKGTICGVNEFPEL